MALLPCTNINIWSWSGQDCDHRSVVWGRLDNAEWIYKVLPVSWLISRWRYDPEEKYWHIELFRLGLWSWDRSLVVIGQCTLELLSPLAKHLHGLRKCQNFDHDPMTLCCKAARSSSSNTSLPVASRWRCDFKSWFLYRCNIAGTLFLHI